MDDVETDGVAMDAGRSGVSKQHASRVVRYEIETWAPPTAPLLHLAIRIDPPDGVVLLHAADQDRPIRCEGPLWLGTISNAGGSFYAEKQGTTIRASVICRGWEEG